MKQKELVKQLYEACLEHDREKQLLLQIEEYAKVFKHKEKQKPFNPKWTVIR